MRLFVVVEANFFFHSAHLHPLFFVVVFAYPCGPCQMAFLIDAAGRSKKGRRAATGPPTCSLDTQAARESYSKGACDSAVKFCGKATRKGASLLHADNPVNLHEQMTSLRNTLDAQPLGGRMSPASGGSP